VNQYIAVAVESVLPDIKRHLVLFDKIAVVHTQDRDWTFRTKDSSLAADLDWLESKGVVFRVEEFLNQECGFEFARRRKGDRRKGVFIVPVKIPRQKIGEMRHDLLGLPFLEKFDGKTIRDISAGFDDLSCRWEAQRLAGSMDVRAVSLFPPRPEVTELLGINTAQGDVLRVVLKDIPEPSALTSLDEILEFRQEPESKEKIFAFRRWVQSMITKRVPEKEIGEELEWLTHQYEEYMRLHRLKIRRGVIEIVITTTAKIAEDLVKIRWGDLSRSLFSLSHRKLELMEAELNAPGRELAYLIHARKALSS
jgi:hypothetical protein